MKNENESESGKNQNTRLLSKKLKIHLFIFDAVNILVWVAWYYTDRKEGDYGIPWPLFISLPWLLILLVHLFSHFRNKKTE